MERDFSILLYVCGLYINNWWYIPRNDWSEDIQLLWNTACKFCWIKQYCNNGLWILYRGWLMKHVKLGTQDVGSRKILEKKIQDFVFACATWNLCTLNLRYLCWMAGFLAIWAHSSGILSHNRLKFTVCSSELLALSLYPTGWVFKF